MPQLTAGIILAAIRKAKADNTWSKNPKHMVSIGNVKIATKLCLPMGDVTRLTWPQAVLWSLTPCVLNCGSVIATATTFITAVASLHLELRSTVDFSDGAEAFGFTNGFQST